MCITRERVSERVEEATNTNEAMQKKKKAAAENCVKKVYKRGETEVESRESMWHDDLWWGNMRYICWCVAHVVCVLFGRISYISFVVVVVSFALVARLFLSRGCFDVAMFAEKHTEERERFFGSTTSSCSMKNIILCECCVCLSLSSSCGDDDVQCASPATFFPTQLLSFFFIFLFGLLLLLRCLLALSTPKHTTHCRFCCKKRYLVYFFLSLTSSPPSQAAATRPCDT